MQRNVVEPVQFILKQEPVQSQCKGSAEAVQRQSVPLSENSWNSKFPIVTNLVISLNSQSPYLSKPSMSDHHKK